MPVKPDFDRTNPHYQEREPVWTYNQHHAEGGRVLADKGYLVKFDLEGNDGFTARQKRAPGLYDNLPLLALQVWNSQLFREEPNRLLPAQIAEMENDVDSLGTEATQFFTDVAESAQAYGVTHVLVDSPRVREDMTEGERQELRLRPWFEHVPPLNLIDWSVETDDPARRGRLNYAVIRDHVYRSAAAFTTRQKIKRYRLFTRDEVVVYEALDGDVEEVSRTQNPVGEVPIVTFYDRRRGPMRGSTVLDDVCMKADALWQAASVRDESFHYQGFNQLILHMEQGAISDLKLGQSRAVKLGLQDKAYYLTPSSVPFDAFEGFRMEIVERVADLVFSRTSRQKDTGQVESAEKRNIDRAEFIALLKRKAQNFESAERQCWELAASYFDGTTPDEIEINYNREFKVSDAPADEWVKEITLGVVSRIDYRQTIVPSETEDEAKEAILENLALEAEFKKASGPQSNEVTQILEAIRDEEAAREGEAEGEGDEEEEGADGQGEEGSGEGEGVDSDGGNVGPADTA